MERDHVGHAERRISGKHEHDAEGKREYPLPASPMIVKAYEQGHDERGDGEQHVQVHDAVSQCFPRFGEEPECNERDHPNSQIGEDQARLRRSVFAFHGGLAFSKRARTGRRHPRGRTGAILQEGRAHLRHGRRRLLPLPRTPAIPFVSILNDRRAFVHRTPCSASGFAPFGFESSCATRGNFFRSSSKARKSLISS